MLRPRHRHRNDVSLDLFSLHVAELATGSETTSVLTCSAFMLRSSPQAQERRQFRRVQPPCCGPRHRHKNGVSLDFSITLRPSPRTQEWRQLTLVRSRCALRHRHRNDVSCDLFSPSMYTCKHSLCNRHSNGVHLGLFSPRLSEVCFDCVLILCFVMGYRLQSGEITR